MSDYSEDAIVRIGDFGSAFKLTSQTDTSDFMIGTAGYMAPEMLLGQSYSFSCDIWGLGCIMYTMFFAQCPFWSKDKKARYTMVCSPDVSLDLDSNPLAAHLSDACKDFLTQLL